VDIFEKCFGYTQTEEARREGYYPYFHEISSRQHSEVVMDGRRTIMLGSNNYLGLTSDDRVIEAARQALEAGGLAVGAAEDVLVEEPIDRPGALAGITGALARAGVNLRFLYLATGTRVVIGAEDLERARAALA